MKNFFFLALFVSILSISPRNAFAQTIIDGSIAPQPADNSNTQIPETPKSTHGLFSGQNYQIQVGFEGSESESPLNFSLSENLIDYGDLSPTDPVIRTNTFSVSAPSSQGYTVQGYENHSLKNDSSPVFIPDTTCDNGICSEKIAQGWNGTLTYGFGYRCDKISGENSCLNDFLDESAYKQFAQSDQPEIITQSNHVSSAQITYKINISGAQAPQFYSNAITLLAVPNF